MIVEYASPFNFWAEAISTACHATNRLCFRKILNKTPYEILLGKKPDLSYLCVFGCKCFIRKKGNRLSKFETRSIEGIFVGYSTNSHGYRVYNKTTGQVEESSDVKFDEDNGSQVGQVDPCAVDDIPMDLALRRMAIGDIHPVEEDPPQESSQSLQDASQSSPVTVQLQEQTPQNDAAQDLSSDAPGSPVLPPPSGGTTGVPSSCCSKCF